MTRREYIRMWEKITRNSYYPINVNGFLVPFDPNISEMVKQTGIKNINIEREKEYDKYEDWED